MRIIIEKATESTIAAFAEKFDLTLIVSESPRQDIDDNRRWSACFAEAITGSSQLLVGDGATAEAAIKDLIMIISGEVLTLQSRPDKVPVPRLSLTELPEIK